MNLTKQLETAKKAAILAGEQIMNVYKTDFFDMIDIKADRSPLTVADSVANKVISDLLLETFPDISVLSEESLEDKSRLQNDWCWIVDPLDGTKEFIKRNGEFTVNIALSYQGHPVLGVIYMPVQKTLYYASDGNGSFKETEKQTKKIHTSSKTRNLSLVCSKSHASIQLTNLVNEHQNQIAKKVSAGSSLKGAMVAEGSADVYYRFGLTHEWDTAAMHCIVEQAGGIFRQMDHSKMTYNRRDTLNEKGFYAINCAENLWV